MPLPLPPAIMKTHIRTLLGVFVSAMILVSCTIEQTYHFREDFSGTYMMKFDMRDMAALGGADSTVTDTTFTPESLAKIRNKYLQVSGITSATATYQDHVLQTGFDFDSVRSLNEATGKKDEAGDASAGVYVFSQSGKVLTMKVNREEMQEFDTPDMAQMGEMVTFRFVASFDRTIKQVKGDAAVWNKGDQQLMIEFPLKDLVDKGKNLDVEIRFK